MRARGVTRVAMSIVSSLPLALAACASDSSSVAPPTTEADPVANTPFVSGFITLRCGPLPADADGLVTMLRNRLDDVEFAKVTPPTDGADHIDVDLPRDASDVDPAVVCATPTFEVRPVLSVGSGSVVDGAGAAFELGPALVETSPFTPNVSVEQTDTGGWTATASLTDAGAAAFNDAAAHCFAADATCPTRQLALVLDGIVIVAPTVNAPAFDSSIQISGAFTEDEILAVAAGLRAASIGFHLLSSSG